MNKQIPYQLQSVVSDYHQYVIISRNPALLSFDPSIKVFEKNNHNQWQEVPLFFAMHRHQQLVIQHRDAIPKETFGGGSSFDKAKGIIGELANQWYEGQQRGTLEAMGVTDDSINEITENKPFNASNPAQAEGVETIQNLPQTPLIVGAMGAATSGGKSVLKNPSKTLDAIKDAVTNSRSPSEALGIAGMQQAKSRLGLKTDDKFTERYHGPDDMARDSNRKLTEIEAKGNNKNSKAVATDSNKNKQGSSSKNKKRAVTMTKKSKKIGIESTRQGGAYTQDELDLWEEVNDLKGNKRHVSTHTNTETGQVKVYERNSRGEITKTLDDFKIENFDEIKNGINDHFSQLNN